MENWWVDYWWFIDDRKGGRQRIGRQVIFFIPLSNFFICTPCYSQTKLLSFSHSLILTFLFLCFGSIYLTIVPTPVVKILWSRQTCKPQATISMIFADHPREWDAVHSTSSSFPSFFMRYLFHVHIHLNRDIHWKEAYLLIWSSWYISSEENCWMC